MKESASFNHKGFTLVEVLAAIVFLAFGILALYRLQATVIQRCSYASHLNQATFLAEAKMESLLSLSFDRISSATAPEVSGRYCVSWTTEADQPVADAKTVRVTVSWTDSRNKPHSVTLSSIRGN